MSSLAARRIASRVARARSGGVAAASDYRHALRDVARQCLYGVDRNPMAVALTKVALWIETLEPGKPLGFLDANIRCGDSLLGVFDLEALRQGIAGAPGHDQKDMDQGLGLPAPGAAARCGLLRLLADLGCEKVTQALGERLRVAGIAGRGGRCGSHEPFLRCRVEVGKPLLMMAENGSFSCAKGKPGSCGTKTAQRQLTREITAKSYVDFLMTLDLKLTLFPTVLVLVPASTMTTRVSTSLATST